MSLFWIEALLFAAVTFFLITTYSQNISFQVVLISSAIFGMAVAWILNFVLSMIAFFLVMAIILFLVGGVIWVSRKTYHYFNSED